MSKEKDQKKELGLNLPSQLPLTALEILASIPVFGDEEEKLIGEFANSLEDIASSENKRQKLYKELKKLNPCFEYKNFSTDIKADILANVVAAIYAPLIHAFNLRILKNIKAGLLSHVVIAPKRDAIPFANSIRKLAELTNTKIVVIEPAITRKVAGLGNNQVEKGAKIKPDPLLEAYVKQEFGPYMQYGFTEIEPGIYSTTSLVSAELIKKIGNADFTAIKFYGLGPNISYLHALLSDGKEWVAERAEANGLVDNYHIADFMTLLDTLEEFGMQNMHQTVEKLTMGSNGKIEPLIRPVSQENLVLATASNQAIIETANLETDFEKLAMHLLQNFSSIVALAKEGYPVCFTGPIPPGSANSKDEHFQKIRTSKLLTLEKKLK